MADLSREIFLRENHPDLCARWEAPQWSLFHARLDEIAHGGMLTASACRLVARGVNELVPVAPAPATPHARKSARAPARRASRKIHEAPIVPLDQPETLALNAPAQRVEAAAYFGDIRRKFETLLTSRHRQSICAFIEVLYRDVVFLPDADSEPNDGTRKA